MNFAPRVVIADDHDIFRQILALTLEEAGMDVIHFAKSGREAVDATLNLKPDIVLMDIVMPEMDGLAALSIIKYLSPETPVFIITALPDPLYLARAGELGAEGFFSKAVESEELIHAIHELLSGERLLVEPRLKPESNARPIPGFPFSNAEPQSLEGEDLTEQERLILTQIAIGLHNQAVMDNLHISKNTLKTHIRNIFFKLSVSDRTQAAIWALQHGYGVHVEAGN